MQTTVLKLDKRRKYYLILDCETATLPFAKNYTTEAGRKRVSIAKPLIYDIGWTIIDRRGRIYLSENYLISEIFSVPSVFNTAYYKEKRPLYTAKLRAGEIDLVTWDYAAARLKEALQHVDAVGAYNAIFDFKKAIPFTNLYISKLYSDDYEEWLKMQKYVCDGIAAKVMPEKDEESLFEPKVFRFCGQEYPLFDVWGLACKYLLNNDDYRRTCIERKWSTESGKYFKTSAEVTFRYVTGDCDFEEAHTALDDAIIESEILARIAAKKASNIEIGIIYFPFKMLGTVCEFMAREMSRG